MRERLYEIIEVADRGDRLSRIYDWVMMVCIVVSLIPLAFKGYHPRLLLVDKVCVIVFIVDYLLRLLTADYKYHQLPPAVAFVRVADGTADAKIAAQLRIPEGTPIIRIARLCTADGRPAIYCEDVVEKALAKGNYTIQDFKLPIFHFLQRFCGIYPYLDLTDVRPAAADASLAEIFQVPMGTPLLNMDEVDYDIDSRPVFCSNEYFVDGIFRHTVMRKKL